MPPLAEAQLPIQTASNFAQLHGMYITLANLYPLSVSLIPPTLKNLATEKQIDVSELNPDNTHYKSMATLLQQRNPALYRFWKINVDDVVRYFRNKGNIDNNPNIITYDEITAAGYTHDGMLNTWKTLQYAAYIVYVHSLQEPPVAMTKTEFIPLRPTWETFDPGSEKFDPFMFWPAAGAAAAIIGLGLAVFLRNTALRRTRGELTAAREEAATIGVRLDVEKTEVATAKKRAGAAERELTAAKEATDRAEGELTAAKEATDRAERELTAAKEAAATAQGLLKRVRKIAGEAPKTDPLDPTLQDIADALGVPSGRIPGPPVAAPATSGPPVAPPAPATTPGVARLPEPSTYHGVESAPGAPPLARPAEAPQPATPDLPPAAGYRDSHGHRPGSVTFLGDPGSGAPLPSGPTATSAAGVINPPAPRPASPPPASPPAGGTTTPPAPAVPPPPAPGTGDKKK